MTPTNAPAATPPLVLSGQIAQIADLNLPFDVAIGGIPFRLAPSQTDPLLWDVKSAQKDQFDNSNQAGENSFGDWWLRSQSAFHGGQGQRYLDSNQDPAIGRIRFDSSTYLDPHVPGALTIVGQIASTAASVALVEQVTWSGTQRLVTASSTGHTITVATLPGLSAPTTYNIGATGIPAAMTTDGVNVFVAINDRVYRVNSAGTATDIHHITFTGPVVLGFVKQRLILCIANSVYELDPNPGAPPVTVHTAVYINPSTDYIYTSIAEAPQGIWLTGYSGTKSDVASMSVAESGGTIVLGPPVSELRLPPGEIVRDLIFYVGSQFVLATSNGIRVGGFTPYGHSQMGPLIAEGTACYSLTGSGTQVYAGSVDSVWSVDLAVPTTQAGHYACARLASGVGATTVDPVIGIELYAGLVFGVTTAGRRLAQTSYAPTSGTLVTSWIRFGTTERKRLHYLAVEGDLPAVATVDSVVSVTVETAEGDTVTFNIPGGGSTFEFSCAALPASQAFRLHITLFDTGAGHGVLLRSYQLKALPTPMRFAEVTLPLALFDTETPAQGEPVGYAGFARDRHLAMLALVKGNSVVTVRDGHMGISYQAVISRLQLRQDLELATNNILGGVLNVILRQV